MRPLSIPSLIAKRIRDDWKLMSSIFLGIAIAATLVAGTPVYLDALERQGLNTAIERAPITFLDVFVNAPHVPLTTSGVENANAIIEGGIRDNISEFFEGHERYFRGPNYLVGLPQQPLPDRFGRIPELPSDDGSPPSFVPDPAAPAESDIEGFASRTDASMVSRGYFQHMTNMDKHVAFLEGRMASDEVVQTPDGAVIEAVLGESSASAFDLEVGDEVVMTPSIGHRSRVTVRIVGILEPADPLERYWQHNTSIFFDPQPLEEDPDPGVEVDPTEPPLSIFVTERALVEGVGNTYGGTLFSYSWFIFTNRDSLKNRPTADISARVESFDSQVSRDIQGAAVFTGLRRLVSEYETRSFFTSVPLLLLIAIMVITVLYYLGMMVGYLVQRREDDVALLRSRGVSTAQLARLYSVEGLVLTVLAVALAPFLAMGAIALAGKLPSFQEITGGSLLPVQFHWAPFAVAAATGLVTLAIFVIPGVMGARSGLVIHKLRSSRPPTVPIFQRYYVDVLLLIIGGLVFAELEARGQFVSGGLFSDVRVNEALLLAPVLFLTVVALLFMRFFPLFVRFVSGEAPTLAHLLTAATLVSLVPFIIAREVNSDAGLAWLLPTLLLLAFAGAYWQTHHAAGARATVGWLLAQAALVAAVVLLEPPAREQLSFVPTISFIALVPAQLVFFGFRALSRRSPVWVTMGLWQMARNPLQYSWLVLLLVLVTGLGVLSTTVGGTLNRSQEERILYEVAADVRVTGVPGYIAAGREALKQRYLSVDGVTSVSMGLRGRGSLGANSLGDRFEILALESQDFHYISWYRDDFSTASLPGVMRELSPGSFNEPVMLPDEATSIGMWVKPRDAYRAMFLWVVLQDSRGIADTITLGPLEHTDWQLKTTAIPRSLIRPIQLVSVQIFEPVFGPAGTPGLLLLDDIQAIGPNGETTVVEDFEGQIRWTTLATTRLSSDIVGVTRQEVYGGSRSGVFSFGKDTDRGIRGFYHSPSGGPLPIVASAKFLESAGTRVGDSLIIDIFGRLIPVEVRDSVNYFPTANTDDAGFILADLDGLLRHLNIVSPTSAFTPNELFIDEAPGAGESVRENLTSIIGNSNLIRDRELLLAEVRLDPLITAGWRAIAITALALIIFTASFGYVTYLLSFAHRSRSAIAFLQSLGLSHRQMLGLIGMEHLVILVVGLGLGSWAGFQMSTLMVSSVAVTEIGEPVVPPFVLVTDWRLMVPIYAALVGIFLGALYWLTRGMKKLDLQTISRLEG